MQNIQSKIKSIAFIGIFLFLLLGMAFMKPSPAAAAVETVTTQVVYQASSVNAEVSYQSDVVVNSNVEPDSPETDTIQDHEEDSDDHKVLEKWFKRVKKIFMIGYGFAWSG